MSDAHLLQLLRVLRERRHRRVDQVSTVPARLPHELHPARVALQLHVPALPASPRRAPAFPRRAPAPQGEEERQWRWKRVLSVLGAAGHPRRDAQCRRPLRQPLQAAKPHQERLGKHGAELHQNWQERLRHLPRGQIPAGLRPGGRMRVQGGLRRGLSQPRSAHRVLRLQDPLCRRQWRHVHLRYWHRMHQPRPTKPQIRQNRAIPRVPDGLGTARQGAYR